MSYRIIDLRFKLTESETIQWRGDVQRIRAVLGRLPNKHFILMSVHVLAVLIDQLDLGASTALVTTKEMTE